MRRVLFSLTVLLLLSSCTKENQWSAATFDVVIPDSAPTRGSADGDGAGAKINRFIMQIWMDGVIFRTEIGTAPEGTRQYTFKSVPLTDNHVYDFLFWADCGNQDGTDRYYNTSSLKNVSIKDMTAACLDATDAFCNQPDALLPEGQKLIGQKVKGEFTRTILLKRPLAQLNIITTDLDKLKSRDLADDIKPVTVDFSYTACTAFSVYSNTSVGAAQTIKYTDKPLYNIEATGTMAMSYLFPFEGEDVSTVSFKAKTATGAEIVNIVDNVPFKRNYRTNISGSLLTEEGNFKLIVDPMWNTPEIQNQIPY